MQITLTSHENRGHSDYYNCRLADGSADGLYLRKGGSWTYKLDDSEDEEDQSNDDDDEDDQSNDADDEEDVSIDTERYDTIPLNTSRIITPDTSDNHGDQSVMEEAQLDLEYLDEDYSDQDSIFGTSHIEYLSNSFGSALHSTRHEAFSANIQQTISEDTGRAFTLVQRLNLELPRSANIVRNRVYIIPPHWRPDFHITRSRITSASELAINEADSDSLRPSTWSRNVRRLRRFIDRIQRPFRRWR